MRKWIIVAVLALVLGGGLWVAVANLDAWLNENRGWVGEQLSAALGRDVSFGEVGISLRSGLGVRARDLRIGEDPAFSKQDFVQAEAVDVRVKLLPALFGEIQVARVVLRAPSVSVIQTSKGLSIDSLGGRAARDSEGARPDAPAEGSEAALAVTVAIIDVRDGHLRWIDKTSEPPVELAAEQIDFSASDLSPSEPVSFELTAAVLGSASPNLRFSGTIGPVDADAPRVDVELEVDPLPIDPALSVQLVSDRLPAELTTSGSARVEARAKGTLAQLEIVATVDAQQAAVRYGESLDKPVGVPLQLDFSATLQGDSLTVANADLVVAGTTIHSEGRVESFDAPKGHFSLASEQVALADLGLVGDDDEPTELRDVEIDGTFALPPSGLDLHARLGSSSGSAGGATYQQLALALRFQNGRATIEELTLRAFEGDVQVSGYFDLAGERPFFDLDSSLRGVRIEDVIESQSKAAGHFVQGALDAQLTARGAGSSWDDVKRELTGDANLVLEDGKLRDVNLAESVLESVTGIPGLSQLISPSVRAKYPEVFGVGETVFEKLDAHLEIRDGFVHVRDLNIRARDYALSCEGRYSLDDALDMRAVLRLSEPLSRDLVASVKEASYLRDSSGRIEIPVLLRGPLSGIRPQPDLRHITRAVQQQIVGGLLDRALGSSKSSRGETESDEPTGEEAPPADATEELLQRGLDSLFKRKK